MASSITTPNAIDALTEPKDGLWPLRFERKGREYLLASGCWRFSSDARGDYAIVPVFPEGRPERTLKVRASDTVRVLSRYGSWDPERTEIFA